MKRKMLFFERFMYVDGMTPINCLMTARLRGTLDPENLRTALRKVQAKHPLLQARTVDEGGEPLLVFDEATPEIPLRIVERMTDEDWKSITVAEWKLAFDPMTGPLFRVVWIRSSEVSDLMLVAHHCICDGGSLIAVLREILQVADVPATELTPYAAYTSLDDLVPAETLADPKIVAKVQRREFLNKLLLAVIARKSTKPLTGEAYVLYWNADATEFGAISRRCTAEGTSVFAALCVAYLQAFRLVQGSSARNKIMCPVNIRRFIRVIGDDMMFAFAPTIALSLPKEKEQGFWALARGMKQSVGEKIEGMKVYEDLMLGDRMRAWVPRLVSFLRWSRGGHDLAFSNMGPLKIPVTYEGFVVERVLGTTIAVPWRNTNTLITSYFQNEMVLAFVSNERFLPQRDAVLIQERALAILKASMQEPIAMR
jgi:NRPS condensation-like uncharacterized protein